MSDPNLMNPRIYIITTSMWCMVGHHLQSLLLEDDGFGRVAAYDVDSTTWSQRQNDSESADIIIAIGASDAMLVELGMACAEDRATIRLLWSGAAADTAQIFHDYGVRRRALPSAWAAPSEIATLIHAEMNLVVEEHRQIAEGRATRKARRAMELQRRVEALLLPLAGICTVGVDVDGHSLTVWLSINESTEVNKRLVELELSVELRLTQIQPGDVWTTDFGLRGPLEDILLPALAARWDAHATNVLAASARLRATTGRLRAAAPTHADESVSADGTEEVSLG